MEAPNPIPEKIGLTEIDPYTRIREDMGDIAGLAFSIKTFGLIQPIIITWDENRWKLLAGGRRYAALTKLGRTDLIHGKEVLVREELYDSTNVEVQLVRQSIELEENIKRKDLEWTEQVEGKRRLLELMKLRYGVREAGGSTRAERAGRDTPEETGFSLRKLSAQLGESPAMTSRDIHLAEMLQRVPALAKIETKTAASRRLDTMIEAAIMKRQAKPESENKPYILYRGDVLLNVTKIPNDYIDLIVTDLPFGVDLNKMSRHATGALDYMDSRESVLALIKMLIPEAFRILKPNRYGVFFFGFNYYTELITILAEAGFKVNKVPFVWYKATGSTENPNSTYANSYDPAIVVMKGMAAFQQPGHRNFLEAKPVIGKLHIAQQPVEVPERFIMDMTAEGALVADFTAGTGTTGEAAIRNCRFPILFEQDEGLCDYIAGRLDGLGNEPNRNNPK